MSYSLTAHDSGPRRALVTGASGFVASHLVKRLVRDSWTVHIVARPESDLDGALGPVLERCTVHRHDGSTEHLCQIVESARPDVVFHLASLFIATHTPAQIKPLITSNLLFGTQLLEACARGGVRCFVNTGTAWQHFHDQSYEPVCLYAATKEAFEKLIEYYTSAEELRAITLYLFDTYGPGDRRHKLLHLLREAAIEGRPLDMSEGRQRIDLTYIDDVVDAFIVAATRICGQRDAQHERYAVCSKERPSLRELIELIGKIMGSSLNVTWGGRPYRAREVMEPWSPPQVLPDWKTRVSLQKGLKRFLEGKD